MKLKNFIEYAKIIEKYLTFLTYLDYSIYIYIDDDKYEITIENESDYVATLATEEEISIKELEENILNKIEKSKLSMLKIMNEKQKEIENIKYVLNFIDK